jgi:hypothetical protein
MKGYYYIILSFFLIISCTHENEQFIDKSFVIKNETSHTVSIKFYNLIDEVQNTETSTILDSENIQSEYSIEDILKSNNEQGLPASAFIADSVRIIFNENKILSYSYFVETMTFSEPVNRNIFKLNNYSNSDNERYEYKITEIDYENAEDCGGNCE